ncbi:MATE family efflux transporter [Butyrivibrio sp. VCB2006]|uniref:MATE family efflux transporter n=1 Tax=Butyrivibrio sp. VCB2006 TaxID=1280679 RepID=UPI000492DF79|nr:MATE family efflux transporter [Butyrivibrio sp. VCB2006]
MNDQLAAIRNGEKLSLREEIVLIIRLSLPAILAQLSSVIMQYIDASMVGHMGANASAAIGLVTSTTWLIGGLMTAASMGFTVSVAHRIGAKDEAGARVIVKWGLICVLAFGLMLMAVCVGISGYLPTWMGGDVAIRKDASAYFLVYALTLPIHEMLYVSQGMIQSSGNIRVPSILSVIMCALDVLFNAIFIPILGVVGAALGTSISIVIIAVIMMYILLVQSPVLHLVGRKDKVKVGFPSFLQSEMVTALKIAVPVAIDNIIMGFAYVAFTRIVSQYGTIAVAANSFSITAESLCYMPGFGISVAATTIIGQCIGARRRDEAKRLGWMAVILGMAVMGFSGFLMWLFAPQMIGILSPDAEIRALGTEILRIEAFAEAFYGAAIVSAGVFRGAGETMLSSVLNLASVWCVRIPLAWHLGSMYGLKGAWIAMCSELCVRGILFLIRMCLWNRKNSKRSKETNL